jgi:hypothetical protein
MTRPLEALSPRDFVNSELEPEDETFLRRCRKVASYVDFLYRSLSPPIIAVPLPRPGNTHLRCKVVTWQPFLSRRCVVKCKRSARKKRKSSIVGLNWRAQSAALAVVRRARRGKKIARRALLMCLRFTRPRPIKSQRRNLRKPSHLWLLCVAGRI